MPLKLIGILRDDSEEFIYLFILTGVNSLFIMIIIIIIIIIIIMIIIIIITTIIIITIILLKKPHMAVEFSQLQKPVLHYVCQS